MTERPGPICFWNYDSGRESKSQLEPYIDPKLQEGTTPLVKQAGGRWTRNFNNFRHPTISEQDFAGPRAILGNRYKLVLAGSKKSSSRELFDVRSDPAEEKNLIDSKPEIAEEMEKTLCAWQESVLKSLSGGDYPKE